MLKIFEPGQESASGPVNDPGQFCSSIVGKEIAALEGF